MEKKKQETNEKKGQKRHERDKKITRKSNTETRKKKLIKEHKRRKTGKNGRKM